jgi:hypothetical protein
MLTGGGMQINAATEQDPLVFGVRCFNDTQQDTENGNCYVPSYVSSPEY